MFSLAPHAALGMNWFDAFLVFFDSFQLILSIVDTKAEMLEGAPPASLFRVVRQVQLQLQATVVNQNTYATKVVRFADFRLGAKSLRSRRTADHTLMRQTGQHIRIT